jgi:hypothetical protein
MNGTPTTATAGSNKMQMAEDASFYLLVLLAALSFPLLEYEGDFLTLFDVYLLILLFAKGVTSGFTVGRTHWRELGLVFAVYLISVTVSALRVRTPGAFLLALKQFEYAAFLLVLVDRFERRSDDERVRDIWVVLTVFLVMIVYQIAFYHEVLPGIGDTRPIQSRRLGLPLMAGVSSNPAGLFLAALVTVLLALSVRRAQFVAPALVISGAAVWALFLTGSRTNAAVLGVALPLSIVVAVWRTKLRWPVIGLILLSVVAFLTLGGDLLPEDGSVGRITRMVREPVAMLQEPSLTIRVDSWLAAIDTWLTGTVSFLFGVGIGSLGATDGTIPRVLAEQGILGLGLFLYVWYLHYLRYERTSIVLLLLFVSLMNGIFAETILTSYRTVQLYLLLLFVALAARSWSHRPATVRLLDIPARLARFWYLIPVASVLIPVLVLLFAGSAPMFPSLVLEVCLYAFAGVVVGTLGALVLDGATGVRP